MMDEAPRMWTAKIPKSMPGPICRDSGAYMVQPAALAPPGTKNDVSIRVAPIGSSQKLKLFMRAKAISEAPICSGVIKLAKPKRSSEERRVGKEWVSTGRCRCARIGIKKQKHKSLQIK